MGQIKNIKLHIVTDIKNQSHLPVSNMNGVLRLSRVYAKTGRLVLPRAQQFAQNAIAELKPPSLGAVLDALKQLKVPDVSNMTVNQLAARGLVLVGLGRFYSFGEYLGKTVDLRDHKGSVTVGPGGNSAYPAPVGNGPRVRQELVGYNFQEYIYMNKDGDFYLTDNYDGIPQMTFLGFKIPLPC